MGTFEKSETCELMKYRSVIVLEIVESLIYDNIDLCSADFTIILISFICLILETEISRLIFLAAVRPFKLIR